MQGFRPTVIEQRAVTILSVNFRHCMKQSGPLSAAPLGVYYSALHQPHTPVRPLLQTSTTLLFATNLAAIQACGHTLPLT